eukprot:2428515-Rhodomonas_salina.1
MARSPAAEELRSLEAGGLHPAAQLRGRPGQVDVDASSPPRACPLARFDAPVLEVAQFFREPLVARLLRAVPDGRGVVRGREVALGQPALHQPLRAARQVDRAHAVAVDVREPEVEHGEGVALVGRRLQVLHGARELLVLRQRLL